MDVDTSRRDCSRQLFGGSQLDHLPIPSPPSNHPRVVGRVDKKTDVLNVLNLVSLKRWPMKTLAVW